MQSMSFLMHSILLFCATNVYLLYKNPPFFKKSAQNLKKLHIIICVLKFIHIFAAVENTKIFI